MNYQLIIQFPLTDAYAEDFDRLLMIENELDLVLRENHKVDGHDIGSGNINIFVYTNEPDEAFELIKNTLSKKDLESILLAFRDMNDDKYSIMWPENYKGEFIIKQA